MEVEHSSYYNWDSELKLSNENFELNRNDYDEDIANQIAFPSDYTLATFAALAYEDKNYSVPYNWKLLTTATNTDKRNGYFGVAFWNPKRCQVVIAHRGTVLSLSNPGALLSDAQLALKQAKTRQSQSAATFVHKISEQIKRKNASEGPCFQLSITGHSLGAWLAQVTTFTVKYLKTNGKQLVEDEEYLLNIHAHTVVFESPGCKETLTKLVKIFVPRYSHRKFGNYDILDMTVYLSRLNPINSINQHVGTIYYIVHAKTHSIKEIAGLFDIKTHKVERKIVLDFKTGMYASCKLLIKKLLPNVSTSKKFVEAPANENEYSLNVFTEDELDFVKDWFHLIRHGSSNVLKFKHENSLPDFEVDYEYNTIKGDNLNSAIACVKRLRPTKTTIYKLLENDGHDKLYSEVFKLEVKHFQKTLLKFHNFCFTDKYNLIDFLKSESQILRICVNKCSKLEYELETSILNNVISYYQKNKPAMVEDYFKQDQYCFLNWNKLRNVRNLLPKILGKGTDKVNLLVIESFEESAELKENILQCIRQCNAKIIIISTDECSWREGPSVKEVAGFGSNITFQDLTEDFQKDFMTQQNLILNGKKLSLSDIINAEFPFSNELYEHINKAIPVQALLQHMLTPLTEVVMDCPYNNLLTSVVFVDLFREIEVKCLTKDYVDSPLFMIQDKENCGLSVNDRNILKEADEEQIIKIQSEIDFEKECLENYFDRNKLIYLVIAENGKLFLAKIFSKNFYIPRNIVHKGTVSLGILNNVDLDQYYFLGNRDKFKNITSHLNKNQKEHFKYAESFEATKERIRNTQINAHLLEIENEQIFLLYSHGNMESLRRYIQLNGTSVEEIEIIKQKITIISGEPGMGKSSTIGYLFLQLKKTHWVFVVPLKHSIFDDLYDAVNFTSAAKFILKSCGISDTKLLQYLLSYCLKNNTKFPVYLMFDGYDEIYEEKSRQICTNLLNFLKDCSTANVLITTRKYTCRELEDRISVFASQYAALDQETEVKNFFSYFYYSQLRIFEENVDTNEIQTLVQTILERAQISFGETISGFIDLPMQMRMLAEILTPLNSSDTESIMLVDILGLYQKYIEMHCNIYFKRIGLSKDATVTKWLLDYIYEKLYKLAIIKIFNTNKENVEYNDVAELNKVGLIQSDSSDNSDYEFLHDSVRDFFIAYFLKLWLESHSEIIHRDWDIVQFTVSDFLLKGEFKEMRFFLNCHLKNVRIFSNHLEVCQNKLQQLWEYDQSLFFNNSQESFFHVCVKENLYFLIKYFLLKVVSSSNKTNLLSKRNADLETPLHIAINKIKKIKIDKNKSDMENVLSILLEELNEWPSIDIKVVLLATLFVYYVSDEFLYDLIKYSENYSNISKIIKKIEPHFKLINKFLDACNHNRLDDVNSILDQFQNDKITRDYLLLTTNESKQTCLHLTGSKEIAERLLKLGADKNVQDHHGMTPLARAAKEGNIDVTIILIRKGASFIVDCVGNSPLYHAAKHNNLDIVKLLLSIKNPTKISVLNYGNVFRVTSLMIAAKNGNDAVVKYLLDKGADFATADWNGMTAIFHAVKGNHTKLIRIFREKGADINIQDQNGMSPLLYSIRRSRWPMVITLLDNGADVNIRSGNMFPLKLLIEMDKKDIIRRVLEKVVHETKKGIVIREAVRIDILTEEEKIYISKLQNIKTNK